LYQRDRNTATRRNGRRPSNWVCQPSIYHRLSHVFMFDHDAQISFERGVAPILSMNDNVEGPRREVSNGEELTVKVSKIHEMMPSVP
jgi:hypothetical protein